MSLLNELSKIKGFKTIAGFKIKSEVRGYIEKIHVYFSKCYDC